MTVKISFVLFKVIKGFINGYVFWRQEGNIVEIKQVWPNKHVTQLLKKYY